MNGRAMAGPPAPASDAIGAAAQCDYDVVVVGAGPGGCATALSFANRGLRVALIEQKHAIDAYKPVCTHYIQGCATAVLEKLGVAAPLEQAGALRNSVDIWTSFGWIRPWAGRQSPHYGYNVRRQTLDPLFRRIAGEHERIDLMLATRPVSLIRNGATVQGLVVADASGAQRSLRARLTVAADGRNSLMARLAGATESVRVNRRTFYLTYYRDLYACADGRSKIWFPGKDVAYAFPCDGQLTLLCLGIHDDNLARFENDLEGAFDDYFRHLPDAPPMDQATCVARITQGKKMHTIRRSHALQGFTMVGDALLASDPFPGVGIGWAIQAGDWLAHFAAPALLKGQPAAAQVRRYERHHISRLRGHVWLIASYSTGRPWSRLFPPERLLLAAAVTSRHTARVIDLYLNRIGSLKSLVLPHVLAVAGLACLWQGLRRFGRSRFRGNP